MSKKQQNARFRIKDRVVLGESAVKQFGEKYRGRVFSVTQVDKKSKPMPTEEFFSSGKPKGFRPGSKSGIFYRILSVNGGMVSFVLHDDDLEPAPVA